MAARHPDRIIARCGSWDDFSRAASSLRSDKERGDLFERLVQLYLQTKPEYRSRVKNVWTREELPYAVRRKLRLPTTDEGIDLIAETREGHFWAIQCKYRSDASTPLTYGELSTFSTLAFVHCRGAFRCAVVAHTCAKPVRKRKLLGDTVEIGLDRWLELTPEDWRLIAARTKGKAERPKPRRPRPHQAAAIKAAKSHFFDNRAARGRMIMPCGTGKSLTAFWIAREFWARSVVVAVPSLALIKQSVEDWTREFVAVGEDPLPEWICVCSDETVGNVERDAFTADVYETGLETTTDPREIAAFLSRKTKARKVVFTTYQSAERLAAAAKRAGFAFDLAILDEAHKTVGAKGKSFAALLSDRKITVGWRLFMTATERVLAGENDDVLSMDDEEHYGERFYQLTFKDAIHAKEPIVSDYKILTITVSEKKAAEWIKKNRLLAAKDGRLGTQEAQALAAGIALRRAASKHPIRHAISFHRSIRAAEEFAEQQAAISSRRLLRPPMQAFHISSKRSAGERAQTLRDFEGARSALMTNARCLTEGVDVPAIDCVLFADPRHSVIDIVQAAGRALRRHKGKRHGYIMVPLIVPERMSFEGFAESTEFRQVARVITALSTQDERIAEEFRVRERGRQVGKDGKRSRERIIQFGGEVPVGLKIDLGEFARKIDARLWDRVGKANWRPFEDARAFVHGLGLRTQGEWRRFCKGEIPSKGRLPPDIPATPWRTYADDGWCNLGDWLGTATVASRLRQYRSFRDARAFARNLKLRSTDEWRAFCKDQLARKGRLPPDIPAAPWLSYANKGWQSFGDWLGTGAIASTKRRYRTFFRARAFARRLKFASGTQWHAFCKGEIPSKGKLPKDIPATPERSYAKKGWKGMGDWLGTGTVASHLRQYRSFRDARAFAHRLNLKSSAEWQAFCRGKMPSKGKLPRNIPAKPARVYTGKGWRGYGDWLGTNIIATFLRRYRPFRKARAFARRLKLKSSTEWWAFCKGELPLKGRLPRDIPVNVYATYAGRGWRGIGDWLGTDRVAHQNRKFRPYRDARAFARKLGLRSVKEWRAYCKGEMPRKGLRPHDVPSWPARVYRSKGWRNWPDWLGTG